MNCEEYLNLIDDLIESELDAQYSAAVNSHLPACPQCAAAYHEARREKEIYASYLSEIAPPADLWAKFEAKLNSESEIVLPAGEIAAAADWKTRFFGFFRLSPALGFAVLLLLVGFVWLRFEPGDKKQIVETKTDSALRTAENYQNQTAVSPPPPGSDKSAATTSPAIVKTVQKTGASNRAAQNPAALSATKTSRKIMTGDGAKVSPIERGLSERQRQLIALERAAARQIEKTEMLLRSFRNSRAGEGDVIDLEYESEQARRLLETNVALRQTAENYGALSTLEILDRVEPFLLDIANLEKSPLPEKVSDIKERVKNQNIIASLQIY
jgi:anti-sigma factor RsiW